MPDKFPSSFRLLIVPGFAPAAAVSLLSSSSGYDLEDCPLPYIGRVAVFLCVNEGEHQFAYVRDFPALGAVLLLLLLSEVLQ